MHNADGSVQLVFNGEIYNYRELRQELAAKGSLFLTRPTLATYTAKRADMVASAESLFGAVETGKVEIVVNQHWPLHDAAEAHRALEARRTMGSTVFIPG